MFVCKIEKYDMSNSKKKKKTNVYDFKKYKFWKQVVIHDDSEVYLYR